ncbi:MAG: hypothetical protein RR349_07570, partial [Oscillospiraceae bacterium]
NAQVNTKNKPQSNGKIGVNWVPPTDTSIGHFEVKDDGTNVVSGKGDNWLSILGGAAGQNVKIIK